MVSTCHRSKVSHNPMLLNKNGEPVNTGDAKRIETLEEVPSPYLNGVFDKILPFAKEFCAQHPDNVRLLILYFL